MKLSRKLHIIHSYLKAIKLQLTTRALACPKHKLNAQDETVDYKNERDGSQALDIALFIKHDDK